MYKNYTGKLEASENCSSCQTLTLVTLSPIKRMEGFNFKTRHGKEYRHGKDK